MLELIKFNSNPVRLQYNFCKLYDKNILKNMINYIDNFQGNNKHLYFSFNLKYFSGIYPSDFIYNDILLATSYGLDLGVFVATEMLRIPNYITVRAYDNKEYNQNMIYDIALMYLSMAYKEIYYGSSYITTPAIVSYRIGDYFTDILFNVCLYDSCKMKEWLVTNDPTPYKNTNNIIDRKIALKSIITLMRLKNAPTVYSDSSEIMINQPLYQYTSTIEKVNNVFEKYATPEKIAPIMNATKDIDYDKLKFYYNAIPAFDWVINHEGTEYRLPCNMPLYHKLFVKMAKILDAHIAHYKYPLEE